MPPSAGRVEGRGCRSDGGGGQGEGGWSVPEGGAGRKAGKLVGAELHTAGE